MGRYTTAAAAALLLCGAASPADDLGEELRRAAKAGDAAAVEALLSRGADVNAKTPYGATALSFAADKGHAEVVRVLLKHKAAVDVQDTFYQATPMSWAYMRGHADVLKLLVEAGAPGADEYLRIAAGAGKAPLVRAVLETGKVKQEGLDKALAETPARYAEVAELLRKAGAKPPAAPAADPESLKPLAGTYRGAGGELTVAVFASRMFATQGDKQMGPLTAAGTDTFRDAKGEVTLAFRRAAGKVAGLALKRDGKETDFTRAEEAEPAAAAAARDPEGAVARSLDWPSFRGPGASGVADGQFPPTVWDAGKGVNLRWKTAIPGLAHSCPVVWGDRVFVTTAVSGDPKAEFRPGNYGDVDSVNDRTEHSWRVYCLDKATGRVLWEREARRGVPAVKRHLKGSQANPTPATDGTHLVVSFGPEGLYCYDFDGNLAWKGDLGALSSGWFYDRDYEWGFGSSPVLYRGKVIVQCDVGKGSFLAAYDLRDGHEVWRTPREEIPSWGTPAMVEGPGRAEVVTNATKFARGYDPETGKELWRLGRHAEITVPTPVFGQGLIFITSGYRPVQPIYAVRPGASGDISLKEGQTSNESVAWSTTKGGPYMPTPLVYGEHLYTCANNGLLTCYETKTGKQVYRERLGGAGTYTASPVAADGRLYFTSEEQGVRVVKAGPKFERLAANPVGEVCMATPAISDGMIFVRGQHHLFAFGNPRLSKAASSPSGE
jgi:outer membrane protein assembly factor BamB